MHGLLLLTAILALGQHTPVYGWLFAALPPLRVLRVPVRWLELWIFGAALLAGFSFDALHRAAGAEAGEERHRIARLLLPMLVMAGALCLALALGAALTDVGTELERLRAGRTDVGAAVSFTGYVRDTAAGRPITEMTLEHYPVMAEAELSRILGEARARWPLQDALVIHRFGRLAPGDRIVLVVTLSAHRQAAFEAAEFLMDYLKTRAPFWKKETGIDGAGGWVDARDVDDRAAERWALSEKAAE